MPLDWIAEGLFLSFLYDGIKYGYTLFSDKYAVDFRKAHSKALEALEAELTTEEIQKEGVK